jgi:hypothetical protein
MNRSQENCLSGNRHVYLRGQGGDYEKLPEDSGDLA